MVFLCNGLRGEGQILRVQTSNIRCNGIWCAVIINNIIRNGEARFARGLCGKNLFSMFA